MDERSTDLNGPKLEAFFSALAEASEKSSVSESFADKLTQFFDELPSLASDHEERERSSPKHSELLRFFSLVQLPLEAVIDGGGLLNLWEIAGLRYHEVRTACALAGLWRSDFGGKVSRGFLVSYLELVAKDVNWPEELCDGYSVYTEVNPLGDQTDRVDLVIDTPRYLIGIEIKIRAGLGKEQLERYEKTLKARAEHTQKIPILILLAPFSAPKHVAISSSWADVRNAAINASKVDREQRTLAHNLIAQFGNYVARH